MMAQELPQTDSIRELAQFWDTHDLTEFEDKLEEVTEPVFAPRNGFDWISTQQEPTQLEN